MLHLRTFAFYSAAALLCARPSCVSARQMPLSPAESLRHEISREVRIVVDGATLNLAAVTPDQSWVVAEINPDSDSPNGRLIGGYIEAETGKFVKTPDMRSVSHVHGSLKTLVVVSGATLSLARYEWDEPYSWNLTGSKESQGVSSMFRGSTQRTALLQINEKEQGAAQFERAYLISEEWTNFVAPATKRLQLDKAAYSVPLSAANQTRARNLLLDENPFVAVAATRTLSEAGLLDAAFARGPLAQSRNLRQALLTFFFLNQPFPESTTLATPPDQTPERKDVLADALNEVIDAAKSAEELKGIALGAYTTRNTVKSGGMSQWLMLQRATGILQRIAKKQTSFNSHQAADSYIDVMLTANGIREPAKTVSAEKPK